MEFQSVGRLVRVELFSAVDCWVSDTLIFQMTGFIVIPGIFRGFAGIEDQFSWFPIYFFIVMFIFVILWYKHELIESRQQHLPICCGCRLAAVRWYDVLCCLVPENLNRSRKVDCLSMSKSVGYTQGIGSKPATQIDSAAYTSIPAAWSYVANWKLRFCYCLAEYQYWILPLTAKICWGLFTLVISG